MFPAGRLDLVEGVYKANPVAAGSAPRWRAPPQTGSRRAGAPGKPLRVLEIGAGTGGTSEHVFAALAPFGDAVAEYCFTDVSRAFLIKAEQRFKDRVPALSTACSTWKSLPRARHRDRTLRPSDCCQRAPCDDGYPPHIASCA